MRMVLAAVVLAGMAMAQSDGFVSLVPKQDVREFWSIEGTPPETWSVRNGIIYCTGKPNGFLRSKKGYKNFVFQAEWRFVPEGWTGAPQEWPNAGFFIFAHEVKDRWPTSLEVQGHFGEAGSLFGVRGGKISGARRGPIVSNRPALGTWDRYEITAKDGAVTVVLNGELVNQGFDASPSDGNICLQSEGWPVQYRNMRIKEH